MDREPTLNGRPYQERVVRRATATIANTATLTVQVRSVDCTISIVGAKPYASAPAGLPTCNARVSIHRLLQVT